MTSLVPFVREAGSGPSVVCIHSNASSSAQWRALIDLLATTRRVLAPDLFGSGRSPDWHSDREVSLQDEAAFIEPVLRSAGAPFDLIGHSHGGAVALISALANPRRVRALVLYEPALFAVVDQRSPSPNGADGIRQAVVAASSALDRGDKDAAARCFIDFWMGAGSWDATPAQRRPAVADSVVNVRRWAHALFNEPTPAGAFAALDFPILYMLGELSPRPAHAVADVLIPHLPRVKVVRLVGMGHMGPTTHPEQVNAQIEQFLSEV